MEISGEQHVYQLVFWNLQLFQDLCDSGDDSRCFRLVLK